MGVHPGRRAQIQCLGIGQPLGEAQSLQSDQPMFVVTRAVIPWIKRDGFAQYDVSSVSAHSHQRKYPAWLSCTVSAKIWACHGSAKTGPLLSRGTPGSASITSVLGQDSPGRDTPHRQGWLRLEPAVVGATQFGELPAFDHDGFSRAEARPWPQL
jgi:hypothetical protein